MPKRLVIVLSFAVSVILCATEDGAFLQDKLKLTEHVKQKAVPLDWKTALSGEERVHYLGEIHNSSETRRELVRSMKAIKKAGITHLAMEMLAEEYADGVRKYCCDGSCDKKVFESFEQFGWDEQGYMAVAEAAQEARITLVAIDLSYAVRKEADDKRSSLKYTGNSEDFKEYCRIGDDIFARRDTRMAENIAQVLRIDSKARVLVYAGANHVMKSGQPKILLEKYGFASRSLHATSRQHAILRVLIETKRRDDPLFIPMPTDQVGFDGYINFPIEWGEQKPLLPKRNVGAH